MSEPRIIFYYQTFTKKLDEVIYKGTPLTHIALSSIHFGKNTDNSNYIHLNNNSPYDDMFDDVWSELYKASEEGIKIILMLGGAGGAYNVMFSDFEAYYKLLYNLINNKKYITGINLDIEEQVQLYDIKMLISKLHTDFKDKPFEISLAPLQNSIEHDVSGMGGFIYRDLCTSNVGNLISYCIIQFYENFDYNSLQQCIDNGYYIDKLVMCMDYNVSSNTLNDIHKKLFDKYGSKFAGGVAIWEYNRASPTPYEWLNNISNIMQSNVTTNTNINKHYCNVL
jgi:hypothetical protein